MKKVHLYIGMEVILSLDCAYTRIHYGWNEDMDQYQDTVQKIKKINEYNNNIKFYSNNYNWSTKDINPIKKTTTENLKEIHFDVKELIL